MRQQAETSEEVWKIKGMVGSTWISQNTSLLLMVLYYFSDNFSFLFCSAYFPFKYILTSDWDFTAYLIHVKTNCNTNFLQHRPWICVMSTQHCLNFPLNGQFWWPTFRGLPKLCKWVHLVCVKQILGNKMMQRKTGEKCCTLYGSLAPECSVNYLWKCWQKRSRFNKARFSGGQHQPTVRWGSVCLAASGF